MKYIVITFCLLRTANVCAEAAPSTQKKEIQNSLPCAQSAQQPVIIRGQEDPDYTPQILATFFGQLVPGLLKIIVGGNEDAPNPQLQADGIQQFSNGFMNFAYLAHRSPGVTPTLLNNPKKALELYEQDPKEFISHCMRSLQQLALTAQQTSENKHS